ncbi:MAG: hypothetical protein ACRDDZ_05980 [Marinifilaceae bacterium]
MSKLPNINELAIAEYGIIKDISTVHLFNTNEEMDIPLKAILRSFCGKFKNPDKTRRFNIANKYRAHSLVIAEKDNEVYKAYAPLLTNIKRLEVKITNLFGGAIGYVGVFRNNEGEVVCVGVNMFKDRSKSSNLLSGKLTIKEKDGLVIPYMKDIYAFDAKFDFIITPEMMFMEYNPDVIKKVKLVNQKKNAVTKEIENTEILDFVNSHKLAAMVHDANNEATTNKAQTLLNTIINKNINQEDFTEMLNAAKVRYNIEDGCVVPVDDVKGYMDVLMGVTTFVLNKGKLVKAKKSN